MASAAETAQKLARALRDINRTSIPPHQRIQIAELFAPAVSYAVKALERYYLDAAFPLSEKSQRVARICIQLFDQLGTAYKVAVHDIAMGRIGSQERKALIVALFRAVRHLFDVVYRTALIYEPYPRHLWLELHNLYAFAETNKWAATRVKTVDDGEEVIATLKEVYVQALLFSLASPYRMRQREIRALYRGLHLWAAQARLEPVPNPGRSPSHFVVRLKLDQPPIHASVVEGQLERPILELDTSAVTQSLRDAFDSLPPEAEGLQPSAHPLLGELSKGSIRRLMQAWGTVPKRQFVRTRLNFELKLAVGLSSIYRLLTEGEDDEASEPATRPHFGGRSLDVSGLSVLTPLGDDSLELESSLTLVPMEDDNRIYLKGYETFGSSSPKERRPPPPSTIWPAHTDAAPEQPTLSLRTLNESAGGYCVRWRGTRLPGIKIGEIIGIQSPSDPSHYGLALVRWMRIDPDAGLDIGLQIVAPSAFAVTAMPEGRRKEPPVNCLLVPELKTADRPASLITPVLPFREDQTLIIRHGETEQRVRLMRLLEATGAVAQFQFEYD